LDPASLTTDERFKAVAALRTLEQAFPDDPWAQEQAARWQAALLAALSQQPAGPAGELLYLLAPQDDTVADALRRAAPAAMAGWEGQVGVVETQIVAGAPTALAQAAGKLATWRAQLAAARPWLAASGQAERAGRLGERANALAAQTEARQATLLAAGGVWAQTLRLAEAAWRAGDLTTAQEGFQTVAADEGAPASARQYAALAQKRLAAGEAVPDVGEAMGAQWQARADDLLNRWADLLKAAPRPAPAAPQPRRSRLRLTAAVLLGLALLALWLSLISLANGNRLAAELARLAGTLAPTATPTAAPQALAPAPVASPTRMVTPTSSPTASPTHTATPTSPPTASPTKMVARDLTAVISSTRVLVYNDGDSSDPEDIRPLEALDDLGISYVKSDSSEGFMENLLTKGPWTIIIISQMDSDELGDQWGKITDFLRSTSALAIIETWTADDSNISSLLDECGVSWSTNIGNAQPVLWHIPTHAIFSYPNHVPAFDSMEDHWIDDGDELTVKSEATLLAGLKSSDKDRGVIALCRNGHILMNSFLLGDNFSDLDSDGVLDAVELWVNEITYMLGQTSAIPSSGTTEVISPANASRVTLLQFLIGHADAVLEAAFSPDGRTLATSSADTTIRLWQVATGALLRTLEGHTSNVPSVAFSPDGSLLASGSWDKTVRLWQTADGTLLRTLEGHTDLVISVDFSSDKTTLASGSADKTVRLWRVPDGILLRTLDHPSDVWSVAFSPDGSTLATSGFDNTIRLWQVSNGTLLRSLQHASGVSVHSVAFSPDGNMLATGAYDNNVHLWRVSDGTLLRDLSGHTNYVSSIAFSPDGIMLASGAADDTVRLWRVSDGTLLGTLEGHTDTVYDVTFSPDGAILASCSGDNTIRLWGVQ
jgi:WD40 repeat protein